MNVLCRHVFGGDLYKRELNYKLIRMIGIHPFASQKSKIWSYRKWNDLISLLLNDKYEIIVFCAPNEKDVVLKNFVFNKKIKLVCGDLKLFLRTLKDIDLLIGLESFSVHAANYLNVSSISLVGSQDGNLWKTPTTTIIQCAHSCGYWPCYNKPRKCDYECINSITVDEVYDAVKNSEKYKLI